MADETRITPQVNGSNGAAELFRAAGQLSNFELSPREPHLYDYLLILRKHQWLILSFMLGVVTIVSIATFRMQPVYNATARIEIDRESSNMLPFQGTDSYDAMMDLENYVETQGKILTSETLAMETIRSSGLASHPDFAPGGSPSEAIAIGSLENQKRPPELAAFLGSLSVHRVPNSRLMDVSFESTNPQLAAQIVNAHVATYKFESIRSRVESTTEATKFLQGELEDLKIKVEQSEKVRIQYEKDNEIWTLDDKQNIISQRLTDVNKELTDAKSDRMKKEAMVDYAKSGNMDTMPQLQNDEALTDLQRKRADLSTGYTEALTQFGPNYPKVQRLQAEMKGIDALVEEEKKNVVDRMESDYRAALQREDLLGKALDAEKIETSQMAQKYVQYNILKREAESNKALYEGLLTKLDEAKISVGIRSSNIRVVDPAMVPTTPTRPAKARNIALAFLVGLVGGVGLALMREYLDNTVKTPDDIERLARLPSLAVVPAFSESGGSAKRGGLLKGASANGNDKRIELVAQHLPKSQMSEAFRALRTALLLSQPGHPPQVILVTSALPREGKTTAAANLAVTLAQLGDSTLLIDGDLRKPGIGRLLNLGSGKQAGLSSYLAGVSSLELVTIQHPTIPNLAAIPTGPLPPNPADLLSSHKMADAITELRAKYKFIVIDSPPIMAATDAVILSVQTDGVLLVVRSGETPKEAFTRTRDLLSSVKCNLLGVVLNAVDSGAPDYYYSYRYYPYSYGYGPQESLDHAHQESEEAATSAHSDSDDSQTL